MGRRASEEDEQLMAALHDAHAASLLSFARRYTTDLAHAEDIVQETLLRAWRHLDRLDPDDNPRGYLLTTARNIITDQWRKDRSRPRLIHDDAVLSTRPAPDDLSLAMQGWVVAEALARLSDDHRAVVQALYYDGRSVNETAARLGVPAGTVKSRSYYAVRALRLALEEMGELR